MISIDFRSKQDLKEKIDSLEHGVHSIVWGDRIYFISKSHDNPLYLGVANLAGKAFAKGGFGKVYDVGSSDLELVFKLSRKRIKANRGLIASQDLCLEHKIMRYIAENAADHTGLNCKTSGLVFYKYQIGVFLEKFEFNGIGYLATSPSIQSRLEVIDQIFKGIETLHRLNIVHRDLKLENTLIKGSIAVISDFGNAYKVESLFKEKRPYPEVSYILGKGTKRSISAILAFTMQNELKLIKTHPFGSEEYVRISSKVVRLIKLSDQFSMALQAFMLCTGLVPPFKSYKKNEYLRFEEKLTKEERVELFEEMCDAVCDQLNLYFQNDRASKEATQSIMKFLKIGLNF